MTDTTTVKPTGPLTPEQIALQTAEVRRALAAQLLSEGAKTQQMQFSPSGLALAGSAFQPMLQTMRGNDLLQSSTQDMSDASTAFLSARDAAARRAATANLLNDKNELPNPAESASANLATSTYGIDKEAYDRMMQASELKFGSQIYQHPEAILGQGDDTGPKDSAARDRELARYAILSKSPNAYVSGLGTAGLGQRAKEIAPEMAREGATRIVGNRPTFQVADAQGNVVKYDASGAPMGKAPLPGSLEAIAADTIAKAYPEKAIESGFATQEYQGTKGEKLVAPKTGFTAEGAAGARNPLTRMFGPTGILGGMAPNAPPRLVPSSPSNAVANARGAAPTPAAAAPSTAAAPAAASPAAAAAVRAANVPAERGGQGQSTYDAALAGETAKNQLKFLDDHFESTRLVKNAIAPLQAARESVETGAYTGFGAPAKTFLANVLYSAGIIPLDVKETLINTQILSAAQQGAMLDRISKLGGRISIPEMANVLASLGSGSMTKEALIDALTRAERAVRLPAESYLSIAKKAMPKLKDSLFDYSDIEIPPSYEEMRKTKNNSKAEYEKRMKALEGK